MFHTSVGGIPNSTVNKDEKEGSRVRAGKDAQVCCSSCLIVYSSFLLFQFASRAFLVHVHRLQYAED